MQKNYKTIASALGFICALSFGDFSNNSLALAQNGDNGDIVVADFEGPDYGNWTTEGEAFGKGPAKGTLPGQMNVAGHDGSGLVNSFLNGDGATGKLISPEIELVKPYVNFLIGGGGLTGTRMELVVDGKVVRVARGPNTQPGGSEALEWATWDVADYLGKKATIQIIDAETGGWGHINVDQIVLSDEKMAGFTHERELKIEKRYIVFPIDQSERQRWIRMEIDGCVVREFEAKLALDGVEKSSDDFDACVDLNQWIGKSVKFIVEGAKEDVNFAPLTFTDDAFNNKPAYDEKYRPQFHFSPRTGWMNDPNGLVYHNGQYELFYQHNPFGTNWGNMTWGHAVSSDLLHWTELGDSVYADRLGTIFSGCGAIDLENSTGFQKDPNGPPPLVFMFTQNGPNMRYGEPASQSLAYSLDGAKTLIKYEGNPVLPHVVGANRDPKIFWRPQEKRWICALYLDGEDYALFASKDLKEWEMLCKIENLGCSECPDIFELPVDGDESKKLWVFWGGNGKYLLGSFDGKTFKKQTEPLDAKWGGNDYAAQTYSDTPGRRIQLSWMSGGAYPGMPFNQQYAIPRELTLKTTPDGVRLHINPVKEVESLRAEKIELEKVVQQNANVATFKPADGRKADLFNLLDLELEIAPKNDEPIELTIRGQKIVFDLREKTMKHADVVAPANLVDSKIKLRVLLDVASIELFVNDGVSQIAKCFVPSDENDAPILEVSNDCVESLNVWKMKSVWK